MAARIAAAATKEWDIADAVLAEVFLQHLAGGIVGFLAPFEDARGEALGEHADQRRHELLPLLDDIAGRDVVAVLARQADLVREGADVVAASAASIDPTDARALAEAPPALARVAVRRWIAEATDLGHPVDSAAIARVLAVADMSAKAADLAEGWRVERTGGRLRLVRE
jgi:hypothetical protein